MGEAPPRASPRHDPRLPALGLVAWLAGIAAAHAGPWCWALLALAASVVLVPGWSGRSARSNRPGPRRRWWLAALGLAAAVLASALLRQAAVAANPLGAWAEERATADLVATVVSDPRPVEGRFGDRFVVRLRVQEVTVRGVRQVLGATVVVLGGAGWARTELGERVAAEGRLAPAEDRHVVALLLADRAPVRIRGPDPWWRAAGAVRASIRDAVADRPPAQAGLVPALVTGDDAGLPAEVESDFRVTGLTHLTAVSGTNLTLVVGALLLAARLVGVRGRWLVLVGLAGIVGFVLLTRTEPSVLRAAAMGTVGLFAFGPDGRRRGLRALGVALVVLLLLDPGLATSAGFALSVLATSGIVLLGPPLSSALARWLPRGLAEAVAVPTAAQLACTPVIAVLSGQVSLVAVAANLLAGPAVGPATVLGLGAGLVGLVVPALGAAVGTVAAWCVAWVVEVARHGADLPCAAVPWGSGPVAVGALAVVCVAVAVALPRLARRRGPSVSAAVLLLLVVLGVPGRPWSAPAAGWPPAGWVLVACDVGQGDALVVRAGPAAAVVVDAGPDPDAVAGCLDRLGVRDVPLLVLTHFHADHVDGLPGVLRDRRVAAVEVSPVDDPPGAAAAVRRTLDRADVPVQVGVYGAARRVGEATVQVVHPSPGAAGSGANDASVVLLVEVAGVRALLTGDVEPTAQATLARRLPGLDVDVLKVPHHGSRHQDERWLASLQPEAALVSAGADNDYGHPSGPLLEHLRSVGAQVGRTDDDGDVAVVVDDDGLRVAAR
ncbi:competence protein ComEC [Nocardioides sp. J9]|uniref:ComEC/Rec2 family competence protein n=1 Tax=Nocardioides sp. J9 TaxID=935844 RepID=UPI0011A6F9E6|nr:ComEC/Rec2 family competence protein [Nocardioides sp. J9]TWG99610.1 competence protein ComEC [Nocardioides sp. J9]